MMAGVWGIMHTMSKQRPGRHCLNPSQIAEVRQKIDDGWAQSEIALHFKVSRQTITNIKQGVGRFAEGARPVAMASRLDHAKTVARFRAAVKVSEPDQCWPYSGPRLPAGYGMVWSTPDKKHVYAHRYALELAERRLGPAGMHACHKCDNPTCCNPEHLFWGTAGDNIRDMISKGRRSLNVDGLIRHNKSPEHRRAASSRIRAYNEARVARHLFRGEMRTVVEIASALGLDRSAIMWRLRNWGAAER